MASQRVDAHKVKYFLDRSDFLLRKCKDDDKDAFVLNTFVEVNKEGWSICTNSKICASLEAMMPFANADAVGCILKAFSKDLDSVFNTKFAHHVLHAAIKRCAEPEIRKDDLVSSCLSDYLDHMWEHYPTYLQHVHGAPALRVYLQLISGVIVSKSKHTGLYDLNTIVLQDPLDPSSIDHITDLANRFLLSEEFNTFVMDAITGPFLQILLIICSKRLEDDFENICAHIIKKSVLLKKPSTDELQVSSQHVVKLPIGFSDPVIIFFVEVLITVLSGNYLRKFMQKNLLNVLQLDNLKEEEIESAKFSLASCLAGHPVACRALRAVALAIKKSVDMESLLEVLALPGGPDGRTGLRIALDSGQHYLFTALSAACRNQSSEKIQFSFEKLVIEAFGYPAKTKQHDSCLIRSIVSLRKQEELENEIVDESKAPIPTYSVSTDDAVKIKPEEENSKQEFIVTNRVQPRSLVLDGTGLKTLNLNGCLLAEDLLNFSFHRPIRIASSIVTLEGQQMHTWARHFMLNRVLETTLTSTSVPFERKQQIFTILKPQLVSLALDSCGSRVVEALWRATDAFPNVRAVREEMVQILLPASDRLATSKFGRFVENLVSTRVYRDNQARWMQAKLPPLPGSNISSIRKRKQPPYNTNNKQPAKKTLQKK